MGGAPKPILFDVKINLGNQWTWTMVPMVPIVS
jgi:hypothetical protein